jgi:hypothetical protein
VSQPRPAGESFLNAEYQGEKENKKSPFMIKKFSLKKILKQNY